MSLSLKKQALKAAEDLIQYMDMPALSVVTSFAAVNTLKIPSHSAVTDIANETSPALMKALNDFLKSNA